MGDTGVCLTKQRGRRASPNHKKAKTTNGRVSGAPRRSGHGEVLVYINAHRIIHRRMDTDVALHRKVF